MKKKLITKLGRIIVTLSMFAAATANADFEVIMFIRHGEKPKEGLGQLSCQGLNRALALPSVIDKFLRKGPDALYAPNPSHRKKDNGIKYDYIRPLATIEPTAIAKKLPVNTQFAYKDIKGLEKELVKPAYRNADIVVAWEHKEIVQIVKNLLTHYNGNPSKVPQWESDDFDSVYIVGITWWGEEFASAQFIKEQEKLNGQSEQCPFSVEQINK